MTNFRMALLDLLRKDEQGSDPQFLRDGLRLLAQELMDAEVTEAIGAAPKYGLELLGPPLPE
jgi:hypothetical protein